MCVALRDRRHAAGRRRGDCALAEVEAPATAPSEDAAVLLQGEAVPNAGGDRRHAASGCGWDRALPGIDVDTATPPDDDAAVLRDGEALVEPGRRCDHDP